MCTKRASGPEEERCHLYRMSRHHPCNLHYLPDSSGPLSSSPSPSIAYPLCALHRLVSVSLAAEKRTRSAVLQTAQCQVLPRGLSLISHSPSSDRYSAGFNVGINLTPANHLPLCMENPLRSVVFLPSSYPTLIFGA